MSKLNLRKNVKISNNIILSVLLVAIFSYFSLFAKDFFSYINLSTMLKNMTISGIIALGLTPLMIARGVDISLGANLSFTSVIMAYSFSLGLNIWFVILLGLVVATLIGLINGFIITTFDISPLVFTIGMMSILQSLALVLTNKLSIPIFSRKIYSILNISFFKVPLLVIVFITIAAIYWIVTRFTRLGTRIYAIGGNPVVADLFGIKTKKIVILLYVFFGFTVGISTIILTFLSSVGNPYHGLLMPLPIISSVVLGGVSFMTAGKGSIWGTILGLLIITVLFNGLTQIGVPGVYLRTFQGFILIMVVGIYQIRDRNKRLQIS